mmetsp:Transcript_64709/g.127022  ORF Transcript_64709/g.127022 Transcript_64709/m.127022 type:complete len:347 (-) Transcript_64709:23-1063(-)
MACQPGWKFESSQSGRHGSTSRGELSWPPRNSAVAVSAWRRRDCGDQLWANGAPLRSPQRPRPSRQDFDRRRGADGSRGHARRAGSLRGESQGAGRGGVSAGGPRGRPSLPRQGRGHPALAFTAPRTSAHRFLPPFQRRVPDAGGTHLSGVGSCGARVGGSESSRHERWRPSPPSRPHPRSRALRVPRPLRKPVLAACVLSRRRARPIRIPPAHHRHRRTGRNPRGKRRQRYGDCLKLPLCRCCCCCCCCTACLKLYRLVVWQPCCRDTAAIDWGCVDRNLRKSASYFVTIMHCLTCAFQSHKDKRRWTSPIIREPIRAEEQRRNRAGGLTGDNRLNFMFVFFGKF